MDLNTIGAVLHPAKRDALPTTRPGDAFLAGGTWLYSEPQRDLARLIDLQALAWPPIATTADTLRLAATCTLAELDAHAAGMADPASTMIRACCRALWGSFKVWNAATVGGNLCLALPAAPMAALAVALDARCTIWRPDGTDRIVPATGFIRGVRRTCLAPGELLRAIDLPATAFAHRFATRQASLTTEGRSASLLVGRLGPDGFTLTVTAAIPRPLRLAFDRVPEASALSARLDREADAIGWYDDVHGAPAWRRHMTLRLAGEIRGELAG